MSKLEKLRKTKIKHGWAWLHDAVERQELPAVEVVDKPIPYYWNGKDGILRTLRAESESETLSNMIHEFAHYLIAKPENRKCPEFRLGSHPDTSGNYDERKVAKPKDYRKAWDEESVVSLFGILIEAALGLPFTDTLDTHGYNNQIAISTRDSSYGHTFVAYLDLEDENSNKLIKKIARSTWVRKPGLYKELLVCDIGSDRGDVLNIITRRLSNRAAHDVHRFGVDLELIHGYEKRRM